MQEMISERPDLSPNHITQLSEMIDNKLRLGVTNFGAEISADELQRFLRNFIEFPAAIAGNKVELV